VAAGKYYGTCGTVVNNVYLGLRKVNNHINSRQALLIKVGGWDMKKYWWLLLALVPVTLYVCTLKPKKKEDKSRAKVSPVGRFVASERSSKFHRPECRYAKNIKEEIWFDSVEEGRRAGYVSCEHCKPA